MVGCHLFGPAIAVPELGLCVPHRQVVAPERAPKRVRKPPGNVQHVSFPQGEENGFSVLLLVCHCVCKQASERGEPHLLRCPGREDLAAIALNVLLLAVCSAREKHISHDFSVGVGSLNSVQQVPTTLAHVLWAVVQHGAEQPSSTFGRLREVLRYLGLAGDVFFKPSVCFQDVVRFLSVDAEESRARGSQWGVHTACLTVSVMRVLPPSCVWLSVSLLVRRLSRSAAARCSSALKAICCSLVISAGVVPARRANRRHIHFARLGCRRWAVAGVPAELVR